MSDESLVKGTLAWMDVLRARAEAGDRRAVEALERHPLLSDRWLADRDAEARRWPSITAWVATWDLGHQRGDNESVEAWALRECRAMGMTLLEATTWLHEVTS